MRLRTVRFPETKEWQWLMQQRAWADDETNRICQLSDIVLNEAEHAQFETFEGTEIRKNRYTTEIGGRVFDFDVYLGKLWGLNRASVSFDSLEDLNAFPHPGEAYLDVTDNPFFRDENIVERTFEDIQAEVARLIDQQ
jgi:CYTH domain-containing protein